MICWVRIVPRTYSTCSKFAYMYDMHWEKRVGKDRIDELPYGSVSRIERSYQNSRLQPRLRTKRRIPIITSVPASTAHRVLILATRGPGCGPVWRTRHPVTETQVHDFRCQQTAGKKMVTCSKLSRFLTRAVFIAESSPINPQLSYP